MRIEAGELAGARTGSTHGRKRRLPSERSDLLHLHGALKQLCAEIVEELGPSGWGRQSPLRMAVYTARTALYRIERNRLERDRRAKA